MENELIEVIDDVIATDGVTGCLFADHQGLCLASKGKVSPTSSGMIVAISEQCCKLQPNLKPPVVLLEGENTSCIIRRHGTITGAIFKDKS